MLIAPLDWGLGHATRCIPIIRALVAGGYEVLIAGEGASIALLQKEFPGLTVLPLQGYRVRYSRYKWGLPFTMLLQAPRLFRVIRDEQRWLDKVIAEHQIDLVISDNRYGLSTKKIPCIFITHQLLIKAPFGWLERVLQQINYRYINRFSCCWIPDAGGSVNVAGILSHPSHLPVTKLQYLGLLSRFYNVPVGKKYDCCILLSGPEPQRSLLEEKMLQQLPGLTENILLVRGKPGSMETISAGNHIEIKNHLPGDELQRAILQSEYIICRSGYTTVMEILALGKKAILIPTPGQTEQEYLAGKLYSDNICITATQETLEIKKLLVKAKSFPFTEYQLSLFNENAIHELLRSSVGEPV